MSIVDLISLMKLYLYFSDVVIILFRFFLINCVIVVVMFLVDIKRGRICIINLDGVMILFI